MEGRKEKGSTNGQQRVNDRTLALSSYLITCTPMATFHFYLRDGDNIDLPTTVHLHVRWNGKRLVYPIGCKVLPRHWNTEKEQVTGKVPTCPHYTAPPTHRVDGNGRPFATEPHRDINERLKVLQASAVGILDNFAREHDRAPERNELRDALNRADGKANGDAPIDLLTFAHAFINSAEGKFNSERKAPFHRATVSRFAVTLELLKEYTAKRAKRSTPPPVYFSEVDAEFVAGFTVFLTKSKGYAVNTVVKYGRTLRLFLRRAKEGNDIGHEVKPEVFSRRLSLKEDPSDQIYLNPEELDAFYRLDLSAHPRLERARDLFIVGAWTGLRFGDLSRVQPEHIEGDRLRVRTSKTGKDVSIPLHPCVPEIMAKYGGQVPSGISNQKQNNYLKEAAALVPALQAKIMVGRTKGGIRREVARAKWELVTTHTARRSFASNCYRNGIPARSIMGVTGHTTEQAFMRYIRLSNEEHADIMAKSTLFTRSVLKAV